MEKEEPRLNRAEISQSVSGPVAWSISVVDSDADLAIATALRLDAQLRLVYANQIKVIEGAKVVVNGRR